MEGLVRCSSKERGDEREEEKGSAPGGQNGLQEGCLFPRWERREHIEIQQEGTGSENDAESIVARKVFKR